MAKAIVQHKTRVIDIDLRSYFDNVRHDRLLAKVAKRVDDDDVMHLLKIMLKANGRCGVPPPPIPPVDRVISLINPILRGWVNYFAVGHASECFGYIQDWVEKKIRRHLMRARKRKGFGWTRWSRQWLYETLKLFSNYKVRWLQPKVAPAG